MLSFPMPSSAQATYILAAEQVTSARETVHVVEDITRSDTIDDLEPQAGTGLVYRLGNKASKADKWTSEEDAKFRKLAAAVAIKKDLPAEQKREFLLLQQRRRKIQLRTSAEQRVWDMRDREFRNKARAALEEYFEFLGSAS
jgi:hypothetical protein